VLSVVAGVLDEEADAPVGAVLAQELVQAVEATEGGGEIGLVAGVEGEEDGEVVAHFPDGELVGVVAEEEAIAIGIPSPGGVRVGVDPVVLAAFASGAVAGALSVRGGAGFEGGTVAAEGELVEGAEEPFLGRGGDGDLEEQDGEALEEVLGVGVMGGGHELLDEVLGGRGGNGGCGCDGVFLALALAGPFFRLGFLSARFVVFGPRRLGTSALEGGRARLAAAGAVPDGAFVQAVQEVVQGGDSRAVPVVGVDAAQDEQDVGGLEVGHPVVDARAPEEYGEHQAAEKDQGVPGVSASGALGVAAQEDGPGGLEVEVPEDLGSLGVALEGIFDAGVFRVISAPGQDGAAVCFMGRRRHGFLPVCVHHQDRARARPMSPPIFACWPWLSEGGLPVLGLG